MYLNPQISICLPRTKINHWTYKNLTESVISGSRAENFISVRFVIYVFDRSYSEIKIVFILIEDKRKQLYSFVQF